jgi:hypothetical protein
LRPQLPQCSIEVFLSTHDLPHASWPGGQVARHRMPTPSLPQKGVLAGQAVVQLPHVSGERRSASHPSSLLPLQSPRPAWQVATAHAPLSHRVVRANGNAQESQLGLAQPCAGSSSLAG